MKSNSAFRYTATGIRLAVLGCLVFVAGCLLFTARASALIPPPGPSSGSIGVQGTIPSVPPKTGATIVNPVNGQTFTTTPITVSGFCPNNLLVKIYDNGIFLGSAVCKNSSYSIQISLFNGQNQLEAHVFDALDQEGPVSNLVTVTFNDAQFSQFGSHVTITSPFARRGTEPSQQLSWPIVISGGEGPYALSIDWGDGTAPQLQSVQFPGNLTPTHTYKNSGTYYVIFKVADKNGTEAYLQVVAVISGNTSGQQAANGAGEEKGTGEGTSSGLNTTILAVAMIITVIVAPLNFWLGRRYELAALRQRIERDSLA